MAAAPGNTSALAPPRPADQVCACRHSRAQNEVGVGGRGERGGRGSCEWSECRDRRAHSVLSSVLQTSSQQDLLLLSPGQFDLDTAETQGCSINIDSCYFSAFR